MARSLRWCVRLTVLLVLIVVPSAAKSYRLINEGPERALVIKAFVKSPPTA